MWLISLEPPRLPGAGKINGFAPLFVRPFGCHAARNRRGPREVCEVEFGKTIEKRHNTVKLEEARLLPVRLGASYAFGEGRGEA